MTEYKALSAPEQIALQEEVKHLRQVMENVCEYVSNAQLHYQESDDPHLHYFIDTAMVWVKSGLTDHHAPRGLVK